jgi:hypothetical protein
LGENYDLVFNDSCMYLFLEQKDLAFLERWFLLFATIFLFLKKKQKGFSLRSGLRGIITLPWIFFISCKVFFNLVGIISNGSFTNHNTYKVEKNLAGQQQRIILKI